MRLGLRRRLVQRVAQSQHQLTPLSRSVYQFLGGAASARLIPAEVEALSIALYEQRLPDYLRVGLFDWEEAILPRVLPKPPARILITSAGTGREAFALQERGYDVYATEPTRIGCDSLRGRLGRQVAECGLAETADTVRRSGFLPDAILIGWGGISHLLDAASREQVITDLAALTTGPIIGSIYKGDVDTPAFRLGRRLFGEPAIVPWGFNPLNGYYSQVEEFELHFWSLQTGRSLTIEKPVQPRVFVLRMAR